MSLPEHGQNVFFQKTAAVNVITEKHRGLHSTGVGTCEGRWFALMMLINDHLRGECETKSRKCCTTTHLCGCGLLHQSASGAARPLGARNKRTRQTFLLCTASADGGRGCAQTQVSLAVGELQRRPVCPWSTRADVWKALATGCRCAGAP